MDAAIGHYPSDQKRSASLPLLHLWQEHFGCVDDDAVTWIAAKLGLQPINILELVTFYPMLKQTRLGKTHIRVCRTLSCAMAGGFELMENLCARLGIQSPPGAEGMSAAAVRYVRYMEFDDRAFAAALVDTAVRGHAKLVDSGD